MTERSQRSAARPLPSPTYLNRRSPSPPNESSRHAPAVSILTAGQSRPSTSAKTTPRWRPLHVKKTSPVGSQPQPTVSPAPKAGPATRPALGPVRGKLAKRRPLL